MNSRIASLLMALGLAPAVAATVTLTDLGVVTNGSTPEPTALGADGSVAVGHVVLAGSGDRAFRWTSGTGMQDLGTIPGAPSFPSVFARAVTPDGLVVVGSCSAGDGSIHAFRWTAGGGMQSFGEVFPGGLSWAANGISADGAVVVGIGTIFANGTPRAVTWDSGGNVSILGSDVDSYNSRANAVSADGTTIVGTRNSGKAVVFRGGGVIEIPALRKNGESSATSVSGDGSAVAGWSAGRAFRWTDAGGTQDLGELDEATGGNAFGINADGSIVVGQAAKGGSPVAFRWTASEGMVDLRSWLQSLGVDVTGWLLTNATAISPDGTAIAGTGQDAQGVPRAWVARGLPTTGDCAPAAIQVEPRNADACVDGSASFQVAVKGSLPLQAQWQRETAPGSNAFFALQDGSTASWDGNAPGAGAIVSGATTAHLTIAADTGDARTLTAAHAIRYRCVVINDCGVAISRGAQLSLGPDTDGDGDADPCDEDDDDDDTLDVFDLCPRLANEPPGDSDADGTGDACDGCLQVWDAEQLDEDRNGIADACETPFADLAPRNAPDDRQSAADLVVLQRLLLGVSVASDEEKSRADIAPYTSDGGSPPVWTPVGALPHVIDAADLAAFRDVALGRASLAIPE